MEQETLNKFLELVVTKEIKHHNTKGEILISKCYKTKVISGKIILLTDKYPLVMFGSEVKTKVLNFDEIMNSEKQIVTEFQLLSIRNSRKKQPQLISSLIKPTSKLIIQKESDTDIISRNSSRLFCPDDLIEGIPAIEWLIQNAKDYTLAQLIKKTGRQKVSLYLYCKRNNIEYLKVNKKNNSEVLYKQNPNNPHNIDYNDFVLLKSGDIGKVIEEPKKHYCMVKIINPKKYEKDKALMIKLTQLRKYNIEQ